MFVFGFWILLLFVSLCFCCYLVLVGTCELFGLLLWCAFFGCGCCGLGLVFGVIVYNRLLTELLYLDLCLLVELISMVLFVIVVDCWVVLYCGVFNCFNIVWFYFVITRMLVVLWLVVFEYFGVVCEFDLCIVGFDFVGLECCFCLFNRLLGLFLCWFID